MNIWIFNHYAVAPGSSGGTRHYDLCKNIVDAGNHEATIFASSFNHQSLKEAEQYSSSTQVVERIYNGVRFKWIKTTPYNSNGISRVLNMLTYSIRSYRHGKKMKEKPDIIIGSLVHPFAAFVGYLLARKKGCTFYFEERDLWPQTLIDLGKVTKRHPAIFIMSMLELFLYKKSKRIIVLFDKAKNYVTSRGISENKVVYLPNGVDPARYESSISELPEEVEATLSLLKDRFIAIYLGSHGMANNLDAMLDAAKKLGEKSNVHFLFVGDGPEKLRLLDRKQAESIDNATFLSPIPKEFVPALLSRVHAGVLPLKDSPVFKWGISPNKLYDYMAASLPVALLCNLEDTPVDQSGGGIVIKSDFADGLAEALNNLSESPENAALMGKKAKDYVLNHHSWANLSKKLLNVIENDCIQREERENH